MCKHTHIQNHVHANISRHMYECHVCQLSNSANGLIERTSSMLDEIESKTVHKDKEGDQYRKKNVRH